MAHTQYAPEYNYAELTLGLPAHLKRVSFFPRVVDKDQKYKLCLLCAYHPLREYAPQNGFSNEHHEPSRRDKEIGQLTDFREESEITI